MISGYNNDEDEYMEVEYFTNYNRDKEEFTVDELDEIEGIEHFKNKSDNVIHDNLKKKIINEVKIKNNLNLSVLKKKQKGKNIIKNTKKIIEKPKKKIIEKPIKKIIKKPIKKIIKKPKKKIEEFENSELEEDENELAEGVNELEEGEFEEGEFEEGEFEEGEFEEGRLDEVEFEEGELEEGEFEDELKEDEESNIVEGFVNHKEGFLGHIREEQKTNNLLCKVILISLLFYLISHDTCKKMLKKTKSKFFKTIDFTLYLTIIFFLVTYLILAIF